MLSKRGQQNFQSIIHAKRPPNRIHYTTETTLTEEEVVETQVTSETSDQQSTESLVSPDDYSQCSYDLQDSNNLCDYLWTPDPQ